jgi:hypothetical protein
MIRRQNFGRLKNGITAIFRSGMVPINSYHVTFLICPFFPLSLTHNIIIKEMPPEVLEEAENEPGKVNFI